MVPGFLDLTHVRNTGAAFGILNTADFPFKTAIVVERLPKTRSGKILRGTMRRIADGEVVSAPATIDDPEILDEIAGALRTAGYAAPGG